MICGIYSITHRASGRVYVGQSRDVERRLRAHKTKGERLAISKAIRKHGPEAFEFTIVEVCDPARLNERERHWIASLGALAPSGFNMTSGGDAEQTFSRAARDKMALAARAPDRIAKVRELARLPAHAAALAARNASPDHQDRMRRLHATPGRLERVAEANRRPEKRAAVSEAASRPEHAARLKAYANDPAMKAKRAAGYAAWLEKRRA